MKKVYFRFYEELNDFLPSEKQKIKFEQVFSGRQSIKDIVESLGVPHTEVDLILVNGNSVGFSYIISDNDDISVYPVFESLDISNVQRLRPEPLREPRFIVDVHLGKLARFMRMFGFDSSYKNMYAEDDIVSLSLNEKRTILTKDREILKRNDVTHGYWLRSESPKEQLKEIISRFDLKNLIKEFSRCLQCNTLLKKIEKEEILDRLQPKVREWQNEFYFCSVCNKIFWKGSHYKRMKRLTDKIKKEITSEI